MRTFELDVSDRVGADDPCHEKMLAILQTHLNKLAIRSAIQGKTRAIKSHLYQLAEDDSLIRAEGFRARTRVPITDDGIPERAPFLLDLEITCNQRCGASHALNVELCFNNREGMGMNFLKIETRSRVRTGDKSIGILICPTRSLLVSGNWDNAYADDMDYLVGYKLAYRHVLGAHFRIIQIAD